MNPHDSTLRGKRSWPGISTFRLVWERQFTIFRKLLPRRGGSAALQIMRGFRARTKHHSFEHRFAYRPDDVVIVSFPKSGSTWLRFIIAHLINESVPGGSKPIDFLRVQLIVPEISEEALRNGVNYDILPSPRIMRSHLCYEPRFPKVIYMLRDCRDVLISYFHHYRKHYGYQGTLYDFLMRDDVNLRWDMHVKSWIYNSHSLENICVVKYEEMLRNAMRAVSGIVSFIGLEVEREEIAAAIETSDFRRMRNIEVETGLGYTKQGNTGMHFIRRGGTGYWRDELGYKEKDVIREQFGDILIQTGYETSRYW